MKFLIFARDFAPQIGGVQNFLANFAAVLPPQDVVVLTRKSDGWRLFDAAAPYSIIRMPDTSRLPGPIEIVVRALLSLIWFVATLIKVRPDMVLCGYAKGNAPFGYLAKLLFRIPYAVFTYGTDVMRYRHKGGRAIRFWLRHADLVATINDDLHDVLEHFTQGQTRIVTIPLGTGVSGTVEGEIAQQAAGVSLEGKQVLLTVCRLTPRKGVDRTIEAMALLQDKHPNLVYVVAGSGDDRARLQKIAADQGVSERVIFAGRVSDEQLLSLYRRADAFILASRIEGDDVEGFGIVFIEAGAFGVPVIGGDSGGVRQAVGHERNGLLVDPNKPQAIADAVNRLLTDTELASKLGAEGKRLAGEVFTWEQCRDVFLAAIPKSLSK